MPRQSVSSARSGAACSAAILAWIEYGPTTPVSDSTSLSPSLDLGAVPERAVLVLQQHHLPRLVQPRLAAGVLQQHQRQQRPRLGVAGERLDQHPRQPDRLVGELGADQRVRPRGEVALVEDQVQRRQHRGQPLGQLLGRGHLVGDVGVADLRLGPDQPLRHRRLGGEEGAGDLGRGEAAERAQGQRDARLRPQRRVAAGEDQPQAVVGHLRVLLALLDLLGGRARAPRGPPAPPSSPGGPLAPQPVDRLVAGDAGDPGARVVGDAVVGPALERDHERLLHRLLGEVEVAEDPDQARDRPSRLVPEQAVDDLIGGPLMASPVGGPRIRTRTSITGRTSTEPSRNGIFLAHSRASSRSLHSSR